MKYTLDALVSADCYQAYLKAYPGIRSNKGHGRLLAHLYITGLVDKEAPVLDNQIGIFTPYQIIEACYEGCNKDRLNTTQLLQRFLDEVHAFPVLDHSRKQNRSRVVYVPTDDTYLKLNRRGQRTTNLADGKTVSPSTVLRAITKAKDESEAGILPDSPLVKAQQMLHQLDPRHFKITDEAYAATLELIRETYRAEDRIRLTTAVNRVYDQAPKLPIYYQPDNSPRLYARHELLYLPAALRRSLMPDKDEMDLQAAHLAISAKVLDLSELQAFLKDGGNPWDEFQAWTNFERSEIKDAVNPFLNGAGLDALIKKSGLTRSELTRLFQHPFLKALKKARQEMVLTLAADGEATLPFTRKVLTLGNEISPLSALAQINQDYEARIISRVFDYAEGVPSLLHILYFQHDGFTFTLKTRTAHAAVVKGFQNYVSLECRSLGVHTRLVTAA